MAIGPRLDLRQSQSLVMTPQLQQAIRLLALSNLEIETFIAEELDRNPLLEASAAEPEFAAMPEFSGEPAPTPLDENAGADQLIAQGGGEGDAPLDVDYGTETFIDDAPGDRPDGALSSLGAGGDPGASYAEEGLDFDSFAGADIGLHEHLMRQAGSALSGRDLAIAGQIIGQIDEAGYLEARLLDIAYGLDAPLHVVEGVLDVIQGFDPTGVCARSLSECLMLQAREANRYDPAMARLIDNLELLARGALPQLRRICGVDEEDMADMIAELRAYDPKPGLQYGSESAPSVVPDLFVAPRAKGGWAIEINSATLPRVLVNQSYHLELAGSAKDKASKAWLSECLASANWLVKALDQRQRTILKVASEIVRQQEEFFRKGVEHLRPLTLRMVADAIEMHESTVSRVTSNKYLACPRGMFELKYFFTSGVQSNDGGEAVSAQAVKSHIKTLIAGEGVKILSDDTLVDMLRDKGFDIARRTVAKYREALGIGSSVQRRRQKAIGSRAA